MIGNARPSSRRLRPLLSFGLVLAMALGVSFEASSQQKPAKPAAAKGKGKGPAASASATSTDGLPPPAPTQFTPTPTSSATSPMPTATALRKAAPPPPKPTDEQLKALETLQKEADVYDRDAREFRDAITTVVKHHYEARRQRVLTVLNRELKFESDKLVEARLDAIKRLEEFVKTYDKPNHHPEHTPTAMFRLAALYEEYAATLQSTGEQETAIKRAIALYKQIIRDYPEYRERAAVFYYLGHILNNAGRQPEAQQVWRALVCNNKYTYPVPPDPSNPERDLIVKKPQDHGESYWRAWEGMHREPIGLAKGREKPKPKAKAPPKAPAKAKAADKKPDEPKKGKAAEEEPLDSEEETSYTNIYPDDCTPLPQKATPGRDPRYIAEVWWQIGEHHFDQGDIKAGPFNFNRAVTGYQRSLASISKENKLKNAVYGVAMYKLAWTFFKQQRYEQAVKQFVALLEHTDEMEKLTGDAGADFRKEAADYIAGSVIFVDFAGPDESEPFITRPDIILDSQLSPSEQEKKLRIGLDRLQDEKLIPQDRKWTIEIYKALAKEYHELNQLANETAVLEAILKKWPLHRDAPLIQDELAQVYERRSQLAQPGSPESQQLAAKALEARTSLADYVVGDDGKLKPWVEANKDDPEAIQRAERLVKNGLKVAAAQHTINARDYYNEAARSTDPARQRDLLDKAYKEYELAEKGWSAYLSQVKNSRDSYESSFWVADSRFNQIQIAVALGRSIPPEKYAEARQSAAEVRDSNEDDKYLEPAAQYVVALTDVALQEQYKLFETSNGSQGVKKKDQLVYAGEGKELKIDDAPPPAPVLATIAARDEYMSRVPPQADPAKNGQLYQYQSAERYFLYGQFEEATKRFEQVVKDQCKGGKFGGEAQLKLLTIARLQAEKTGDYTKVKELNETLKDPEKICAASEEEKDRLKKLAGAAVVTGAYQEAYAAFEKACMPDAEKRCKPGEDTPERRKNWRLAAELYEAALKTAPDRAEAPEAAINGAFSYKQIGEYDKAIEMYTLFIDKYGDEKILAKLEKGNEKEKKQYSERIKYLYDAYSSLSEAYVLFFNYRAAAETYEKIANIERFDQLGIMDNETKKLKEVRKDAARNALVLYTNLNDREKMLAAKNKFLTFKPSDEDKAEADYIVASADLKQWDERGESEANQSARQKAIATMTSFYNQNKKNKAATQYTVIAAYWVAKMKASTGDKSADEWWKNTIGAFTDHKAAKGDKVKGTPEATMAAEADFTMQDAEIKKNFDYDSGHHRYKGTVVDVIKKYQADNKDAQKYYDKLERIASLDAAKNAYGSPDFIVAAIARQGSLYDSLRTGFFNTREPALQLFSAQEEKLLKKLEESGNDDYMEKAMLMRESRTQLWRKKRDEELKAADTNMVFKYTLAVVLARKYSIRSPTIKKTLQRLAFFTDLLGDPKMQEYTAPVEKNADLNFKYENGMFQKTRPGMVVEPEISIAPPPLPVLLK